MYKRCNHIKILSTLQETHEGMFGAKGLYLLQGCRGPLLPLCWQVWQVCCLLGLKRSWLQPSCPPALRPSAQLKTSWC